MAANIGSGGGANVHFDEALVSSTPPQKKPEKKDAGKSILKPTAPVVPASEEQLHRDRIKSEFVRQSLGVASPRTKPVLDAFFALGGQQSARLKPEMRSGSATAETAGETRKDAGQEQGEENKKG